MWGLLKCETQELLRTFLPKNLPWKKMGFDWNCNKSARKLYDNWANSFPIVISNINRKKKITKKFLAVSLWNGKRKKSKVHKFAKFNSVFQLQATLDTCVANCQISYFLVSFCVSFPLSFQLCFYYVVFRCISWTSHNAW